MCQFSIERNSPRTCNLKEEKSPIAHRLLVVPHVLLANARKIAADTSFIFQWFSLNGNLMEIDCPLHGLLVYRNCWKSNSNARKWLVGGLILTSIHARDDGIGVINGWECEAADKSRMNSIFMSPRRWRRTPHANDAHFAIQPLNNWNQLLRHNRKLASMWFVPLQACCHR